MTESLSRWRGAAAEAISGLCRIVAVTSKGNDGEADLGRSRTKDKEGPQGINYVQRKKLSIEEEDSRSGRSEILHGDGAPAAV
ncbi:hypothetical protein HYQ46_005960 [Verticillium longisporum]|nr:hypothetical protein HYQ46_005960 [Verticillium longisporum]